MEEEKEIDFEIVEEERSKELKLEEKEQAGDDNVLRFLDSIDSYLILLDSLSSKLRQGWLELASARHSMGTLRLNTALLDLKFHSASTSVQVTQDHVDEMDEQTQFVLHKWGSMDSDTFSPRDEIAKEDELQRNFGSPKLRHRRNSQLSEEVTSPKESSWMVDDQVQKERLRSLSMFGTLVPPKLRAAQLSFETALEKLIEIANTRSALLSASDQVSKEMNVAKEMRWMS